MLFESLAPAQLDPEGLTLATRPRGYPRRLGALQVNRLLLFLKGSPPFGRVLGG